jgi:hypothetical protein
MYCRNCGTELKGTPEYCMNCGARPLIGNKFCSACAAPTNPLAEICLKCGAKLPAQAVTGVSKGGKSKVASILLAVFLGYWTWLYTYKKDGWKFWTGIGLSIFVVILVVATFGIAALFTWVISLGIWIWAIVDTAIKSDSWYYSY